MSKPSKQAIFNRVATHLLTQKKRAFKRVKDTWGATEDVCVYRTNDGRSCAVGCLFNNREARIADSNGPANVSMLNVRGQLPERFSDKIKFLTDLQLIHDSVLPSRWIQKLSAFAKDHKLNADVLKQFR